jgi:hypothetical protein
MRKQPRTGTPTVRDLDLVWAITTGRAPHGGKS